MTSFNPEELFRDAIFVTTTPSLLPLQPPGFHDEPQDDLSSFPGPGRYVFSLEYQKLYVETEQQMQKKKGEGKKVKAGKVRKKVDKEWNKRGMSHTVDLFPPAGASNGDNSEKTSFGGEHQRLQQKREERAEESEEESEED
ncbi:hypothetical protein JCM11251_007904 [Rhodosporidiobolus azoricus]